MKNTKKNERKILKSSKLSTVSTKASIVIVNNLFIEKEVILKLLFVKVAKRLPEKNYSCYNFKGVIQF